MVWEMAARFWAAAFFGRVFGRRRFAAVDAVSLDAT
jgi:hypothetical protein